MYMYIYIYVQCLDLAEVFGSLQQSQKVQAAAGGAAPVQAGALFCVVRF